MLRKLKRSVARAKMQRLGLDRLNKRRFNIDVTRAKSKFAGSWRKYLTMPVVYETKATQDAAKAREQKKQRKLA